MPPATPPEPSTSSTSPEIGAIVKQLGPAGVLAGIAMTLPALGGFVLIGFIPRISDWLRASGSIGPWVYGVGFAVCAGCAILPTYAQAALGGYAFGMGIGLIAALGGFAGGAAIGYELARRASGERVMRLVRTHPRAAAIRDAFVSDSGGRGFWKTLGIVALVRMPPSSPFAPMNVLMASVQVPRAPYLLGTVLGMLPRTAAMVWIGHAFGLAAKGGFASPRWYVISGIVVSLVVLGVIMALAERAVRRLSDSAARAAE